MSEVCKEIPLSKLRDLHALVEKAQSPLIVFGGTYEEMSKKANQDTQNNLSIIETELRKLAEIS